MAMRDGVAREDRTGKKMMQDMRDAATGTPMDQPYEVSPGTYVDEEENPAIGYGMAGDGESVWGGTPPLPPPELPKHLTFDNAPFAMPGVLMTAPEMPIPSGPGGMPKKKPALPMPDFSGGGI